MSIKKIAVAIPSRRELDSMNSVLSRLPVEMIHCGAGPALSAMNIAIYLCQHRPDMVIMAGIAGVFPGKGAEGDVVLASSEAYGDIGRCSGDSINSISVPPDEMPVFFPMDYVCQYVSPEFMRQEGILYGPCITVSCASASRTACSRITRRFPDAICENMEGASGAMTCRRFGLPFLELRGMSNMAGDADTANWQIDNALDRVCRALLKIVESII